MRIGFITVTLAFFVLLGYVVWHLWRITPGGWPVRIAVAMLFLLWMVLPFAGMSLSEKVSIPTATAIFEAGHPWMIAFLYLSIIFVVADLAVICRILPRSLLSGNLAGLLGVAGIVAIILISGRIHYHHKYREELTIRTSKPLEKSLTIVLASDLHIGYTNRRKELARWIRLINAAKPDLVLFGGDVIDLRLRPVIEGGYAEEFHRLSAPAMTVLGNHEYYGDVNGAEVFFTDAGINLLRDTTAFIDGIAIIGRDDHSNHGRKSLSELTGHVSCFTILLDHQPYHLEEAEQSGIDFQFSGHTHHGQVWPLSWVTNAMYEKAWGHLTRGNTRYYISSGLGIWGPKFRIGTRSEYLVLHIESYLEAPIPDNG